MDLASNPDGPEMVLPLKGVHPPEPLSSNQLKGPARMSNSTIKTMASILT